MPGIKTSVWLGETEHAQWKASGKSLTEIVKAGLATIGGAPADPVTVDRLLEELDAQDDRIRRIVRDELARVAGQPHD